MYDSISYNQSCILDIREEDEIIMIDDLRITNIDLRSLKDHLNKVPLVLTLRSARLDTDRWKQKSPTENMLHRDRVSTGKFFTDEQRLEKVIDELIQTERSYIQVNIRQTIIQMNSFLNGDSVLF